MMIHDNDDTSTGPWQVSVDDYLQYGRSRPPCCSNALETWGSTWGSYRLINLIHVIHLGKLQVAADSAQLCNCATEKAATLYCHCMQLHATQGDSRKLTFKHFFPQEKPEHGHDGHSLWLKSFWYLIFPRFALTSKGHVSLASEYKCLHHSHPFCMFFSQLLDDQPQVSTQVCLALPPCPWPWTLPSTHTTVFCIHSFTFHYFVHQKKYILCSQKWMLNL